MTAALKGRTVENFHLKLPAAADIPAPRAGPAYPSATPSRTTGPYPPADDSRALHDHADHAASRDVAHPPHAHAHARPDRDRAAPTPANHRPAFQCRPIHPGTEHDRAAEHDQHQSVVP
ncbi:putative membrane protein [Streptomyces sp. V4I8]|uniref:hypothetical protein n=1 Tax=Streptomyces sp. V4I8 TaxID=3156469 RepID=UPI003512DCBE